MRPFPTAAKGRRAGCSSTDTDTVLQNRHGHGAPALRARLLRLPWTMCLSPRGRGQQPTQAPWWQVLVLAPPGSSTRGNHRGPSQPFPSLSASHSRATHTKAGGEKGTCPLHKLRSWTCWLPSLLPPPVCSCPSMEVTWPHSWN